MRTTVPKSKRLTLRIGEVTLNKAGHFASKRQVSLSEYVRAAMALKMGLDQANEYGSETQETVDES